MADVQNQKQAITHSWSARLVRLRLISGLVLLSYLFTHMLNHALGLISLQVLEAGEELFEHFWRFLPMTLLLYGAFLAHMSLAFWSLYRKRHLIMPLGEKAQYLFGFTLPLVLFLHVIATRLAATLYGTDGGYIYVLLSIFYYQPWTGVQQVIITVLAWAHGLLGLHYWFRLRPWYPRWRDGMLGFGVLLPAVSVAGVLVAQRDLKRLIEDPAVLERLTSSLTLPTADQVAFLYRLTDGLLLVFFASLGILLAARMVRARRAAARASVIISYPGDRQVAVAPGTTVLDASRLGSVPHASVCGGRGRCSTCRVRVGAGKENLPTPDESEARVLLRIGAAPDIRLACQIRPAKNLNVTPLLPPSTGPQAVQPRAGYLQGEEREVAVLFCDLRGFTTLSEARLPYDVVFILNRYFSVMGHAIEDAGGHLDKFIGDGIMALFGITEGPEEGARRALRAAQSMAASLAAMNVDLDHDLVEPLRMGIGIHLGSAIVGEMGYGRATGLTAVGDTVNTAARLEAMTKTLGVELVVSEEVIIRAGLRPRNGSEHEVEIRGRAARQKVTAWKSARDLGDFSQDPESASPVGIKSQVQDRP